MCSDCHNSGRMSIRWNSVSLWWQSFVFIVVAVLQTSCLWLLSFFYRISYMLKCGSIWHDCCSVTAESEKQSAGSWICPVSARTEWTAYQVWRSCTGKYQQDGCRWTHQHSGGSQTVCACFVINNCFSVYMHVNFMSFYKLHGLAQSFHTAK